MTHPTFNTYLDAARYCRCLNINPATRIRRAAMSRFYIADRKPRSTSK